METMARETWTDERLDDLKDGMHREFDQVRTETNRRFDEVDRRFDEAKKDSQTGFDRVDTDIRELRSEMNAGFEAVNARFDSLNRNLFVGAVSIFTTLLAAILGKGIF